VQHRARVASGKARRGFLVRFAAGWVRRYIVRLSFGIGGLDMVRHIETGTILLFLPRFGLVGVSSNGER
jgi:hypothetical protein